MVNGGKFKCANKMLLEIINEIEFYALPSTLWALHIDPDYKFVVVNRLDVQSTSVYQIEIDKQIYVHYNFQKQSTECVIFINQRIVPTAPIPSLKTEITCTAELFDLIFKLDDLRICPNAKIDDYCLLLISDRHSQNCSNCNSIVVAQSIETTNFQLLENTEIIENVLNETFNQDSTLRPQSTIPMPLTPILSQLLPQDLPVPLDEHDLDAVVAEQPQLLNHNNLSQTHKTVATTTTQLLNDNLLTHTQIHQSDSILPQLQPLLISSEPMPQINSMYECTKCTKKFRLEKLLKNHLLKHEKRTLCPICGITLAASSRLSKHLKIHKKSDEKASKLIKEQNQQINLVDSILSLECDICFEIFDNENGLKVHRGTMHETEKQSMYKLSCEICQKLFSSRQNLRTHLLSVHSTVRPYKCIVCDKGFVYPRLLKNHMRIHTDEKRFSCPFCDKDLTTKEHLRVHLRIHTGSRPFSCEICSKTFTTIGNLKGHLKIHNTDNEFC